MELKRAAKVFGKSLEAKVTLHCDGDLYEALKASESQLPDLFIASQVEVVKGGEGEVQGDTEGLLDHRRKGGKAASASAAGRVLPEVGADAAISDPLPPLRRRG